MPPTQERKIPTSAGMETATETVNRIKSQIGANNVPASVLSAPQQPDLDIPQTNVPQVSAGTAIAGAEQLTGTLQQQEAQRTQAEVQQAGAKLSDSERAIREAVGIIGTEGQARTQLEDSAGMTQMKNQLNQLSNQLFNQTNALRQFDVDNVNTIEQMRVDASKRDITKRTFGAQSAEAGIQMAVQRANMVGELYATQSSVQLLQGNIQQAAESIDKALQSIYEPKRQELQMEMMFFQRNGQLFDSAQNRAANARMEVIRQEQAQIDRAIMNVDTAVASGYATDEDIKAMTGLSGDPKAQKEYADKIIAKAMRAKVAQENARIAASNSATSWSQRAQAYNLAMNGDPAAIEFLGFDPRQNNMSQEDTFNFINETAEIDRSITNLERMLGSGAKFDAETGEITGVSKGALDAMTGVSRSAFLTASARFGGPSLIAGGAAGSVVPGVGTLAGSAIGYVAGTAAGTVAIANERRDMLTAANFLVNEGALAKLLDFKARGGSVGALTEGERIAFGKAATALFSALEVKGDGTVTSVNVTPQRYQELIVDYYKELQEKKAQKAVLFSGVNSADYSLVESF
jgi:hypothetical protein